VLIALALLASTTISATCWPRLRLHHAGELINAKYGLGYLLARASAAAWTEHIILILMIIGLRPSRSIACCCGSRLSCSRICSDRSRCERAG